MSNNTDIYFGSRNVIVPFQEVLIKTQTFLSDHHSDLLMEKPNEENKKHLNRYMRQFLIENNLRCEGMDLDGLVQALYREMVEFSILTEFLERNDVEEINVNAWNDIEVIYNNGSYEKPERTFDSPLHAINVIRRMLHQSGNIIDDAMPLVLGHLGKNIRIAALKTPLVDEDVGISCSIRIVNPSRLSKEDFIKAGTATKQMLDFLSLCIQYGVSICVAGATSSGKTTLLEYLLTTIPNDLRVYTIENGSREFDLVKKIDGKVVNRVVQTLTRPSEDAAKNIDTEGILDVGLRYDPDIIVVGEMRGPEAYNAQEAARTGHTVLTTIHSNSAEATYGRMVTLCKRASDLDKADLMENVVEAFPIVVFARKLQDKSRKLMDVLECELKEDGSREYHHIFRYFIKKNLREGDRVIIDGEFRSPEQISEKLFNMLRDNGMSDDEYEGIFGSLPDYELKEVVNQ